MQRTTNWTFDYNAALTRQRDTLLAAQSGAVVPLLTAVNESLKANAEMDIRIEQATRDGAAQLDELLTLVKRFRQPPGR